MTIRHLESFFSPKTVALIGASTRAHSVGATILANLRRNFQGTLLLVNPHHDAIEGLRCHADVAALPQAPELAVICTPAHTLTDIITALGRKGCKAAIIITGGINRQQPQGQGVTAQQLQEAARPFNLRIIGPNCLGILMPNIGLNASFAHTDGLPGKIAFVSQSGALATAVLDWSKARGIGFSSFITIGDALDVDFGDLLDYLASDSDTRAILLYIESIKHARKFMSAARAAARAKPVIAVKSGRAEEGSRAVVSHTGALAGSDDVMDTALRRAGILRVETLQDLFDAAETLARSKPLASEQLVIVTNGGGAGVLATDALIRGGGKLATLSADTIKRLDAILPSMWSRGNPVDIIGDAPAERYAQTLTALAEEPAAGAILLMHAPTAIVSSRDIAQTCLPAMHASTKPVLTCWLGDAAVRPARTLFARENIPGYATPEEAVRAFLQLCDFRRNQDLLLQTPAPMPLIRSDSARAASQVAQALREGRTLLSEIETKNVLAGYGIPVVTTTSAASVNEAVTQAERIGYPVVIKILSPDITHKSDIGGVALHLTNAEEVRFAAQRMQVNVATHLPHARLTGFTVQKMVLRTSGAAPAHELILGCTVDPVFGPVIMFGQGGTGVEVMRDRAFALPPLNSVLARDLISRTRVARLLAGYRDRPAVNESALVDTLLRFAQLVCDQPQIGEIEINPLLADEQGVIALDARMRVEGSALSGSTRLAILPYPAQLAEFLNFDGRPVTLRPIRAEDEAQHRAFLEQLSPEDVHLRFFYSMRSWTHHQLARFTQIDYDREMAFVAVTESDSPETLGVVRAISNPDNTEAEFAIVVRSDLKGKGLGYRLMRKIIDYQRAKGTEILEGDVLTSNTAMVKLGRALGFDIDDGAQSGVSRLRLKLRS